MRERNEDHFRCLGGPAKKRFEAVEKRSGIGHRKQVALPFCHNHAVLMNRVSGIGRDDHIAWADDREQ